MRAVIYTKAGDTSVLRVVERPLVESAQGEVRIRVGVSGVNPTDWKSRSGAFGGSPGEPTVPNHDGAGIVDALGSGVTGIQTGDRVWVTLAADGRPASGTAQEYTVVPAERVFPLPDSADFELGASIGIPGATAHRALTVAENGPSRLEPGALRDRTVLIAGGAGAVGNAAIQLHGRRPRWRSDGPARPPGRPRPCARDPPRRRRPRRTACGAVRIRQPGDRRRSARRRGRCDGGAPGWVRPRRDRAHEVLRRPGHAARRQ